jgi:hypothetical protein
VAAETRRLEAGERVAGRAFADPAHGESDLATLGGLRAALARAAARGPRPGALRFSDEIGEHAVAVPDWTALESAQPIALVGFFGQAREDVDHAPISALEGNIVARASAFRGLLAYHNARLVSGQWGNLVLFASRADAVAVTQDATHARAVALTAQHYESLRLHRGRLADGCLGRAQLTIDETLYLDFRDSPAWRGLRVYAPDASR